MSFTTAATARSPRRSTKPIAQEKRNIILRELANSNLSVPALAEKHGVSVKSIYKWRKDIKVQQQNIAPLKLQKPLTVKPVASGFTEVSAGSSSSNALSVSSNNNNRNNLISVKLKFKEFSILVEGNIKTTILQELSSLANLI